MKFMSLSFYSKNSSLLGGKKSKANHYRQNRLCLKLVIIFPLRYSFQIISISFYWTSLLKHWCQSIKVQLTIMQNHNYKYDKCISNTRPFQRYFL